MAAHSDHSNINAFIQKATRDLKKIQEEICLHIRVKSNELPEALKEHFSYGDEYIEGDDNLYLETIVTRSDMNLLLIDYLNKSKDIVKHDDINKITNYSKREIANALHNINLPSSRIIVKEFQTLFLLIGEFCKNNKCDLGNDFFEHIHLLVKINDIQVVFAPASESGGSAFPPEGCEQALNANDHIYYIVHAEKKTQWNRPSLAQASGKIFT